jgi:hypothetical protein
MHTMATRSKAKATTMATTTDYSNTAANKSAAAESARAISQHTEEHLRATYPYMKLDMIERMAASCKQTIESGILEA